MLIKGLALMAMPPDWLSAFYRVVRTPARFRMFMAVDLGLRRRAKTTASWWHLPNSSWPGLSRPPIAAEIRGFFLPSLVPGTSLGMTRKKGQSTSFDVGRRLGAAGMRAGVAGRPRAKPRIIPAAETYDSLAGLPPA